MFLKLLDTKTARVKEVKVSCDWSCTVHDLFVEVSTLIKQKNIY